MAWGWPSSGPSSTRTDLVSRGGPAPRASRPAATGSTTAPSRRRVLPGTAFPYVERAPASGRLDPARHRTSRVSESSVWSTPLEQPARPPLAGSPVGASTLLTMSELYDLAGVDPSDARAGFQVLPYAAAGRKGKTGGKTRKDPRISWNRGNGLASLELETPAREEPKWNPSSKT
jgi:hypothetical protein